MTANASSSKTSYSKKKSKNSNKPTETSKKAESSHAPATTTLSPGTPTNDPNANQRSWSLGSVTPSKATNPHSGSAEADPLLTCPWPPARLRIGLALSKKCPSWVRKIWMRRGGSKSTLLLHRGFDWRWGRCETSWRIFDCRCFESRSKSRMSLWVSLRRTIKSSWSEKTGRLRKLRWWIKICRWGLILSSKCCLRTLQL